MGRKAFTSASHSGKKSSPRSNSKLCEQQGKWYGKANRYWALEAALKYLDYNSTPTGHVTTYLMGDKIWPYILRELGMTSGWASLFGTWVLPFVPGCSEFYTSLKQGTEAFLNGTLPPDIAEAADLLRDFLSKCRK